MLLTKYNPFAKIAELERELFHKYDDTYDDSGMSGFTPTVNTSEGAYAFHIDADLPGGQKRRHTY